MEASTLRCPGCGAAAPRDATRCPYCAVELATMACPKCLGLEFKGAKHCSHCGAELEALAAQAGPSLPCPTCKGSMTPRQLGGRAFQSCERCGGAWMVRETLELLCQDQEQQSAMLDFLPPAQPAGPVSLALSYRPCPQCGKLMNRVNFAQVSGVILDACRPHGSWFDKDELRRLIGFIRGGGLEKARVLRMDALKAQEQATKLAARLEAMQGAQNLPASHYSLGGPSFSGGGLLGNAAADVLSLALRFFLD